MSIPNLDVERAVADGEPSVYVWKATGTHDSPLASPTGVIAPSGCKGKIMGVFAAIRKGKIVRQET